MSLAKRCACVLTCVLITCLVFTGCNKKKEDYRKDFVGTWEIVDITQTEKSFTEQQLNEMKTHGLNVYLDLREDGTSELDLFGSTTAGTWQATSWHKAKMTMKEQAIELHILDNGLLELSQDKDVMQFKQIEESEKRYILEPINIEQISSEQPTEDSSDQESEDSSEESEEEIDEAA